MVQAGQASKQLVAKRRIVVTSKLQLDGSQLISAFHSELSSCKLSIKLSPTQAIAANVSFYEHKTSCLKNSAKFKDTNNFLNEDVSPAA